MFVAVKISAAARINGVAPGPPTGFRSSPSAAPAMRIGISTQLVMRNRISTVNILPCGIGYTSSFRKSSDAPKPAEITGAICQ